MEITIPTGGAGSYEQAKADSASSYTVICRCSNCGWNGRITIRKGNLVRFHSCPQCECRTIARTA